MNRLYQVFYNFIGAIIGLSIGMSLRGEFNFHDWGLKLAICLLAALLVELLITPLIARIINRKK